MKLPLHATLPLAAIATLNFSSCKNPADNAEAAEISDAKTVATSTEGERYTFTEASTIGFIGSKVTGSHEGGFKAFEGHFIVNNEEPVAGSFEIDMASTWSDDEKLTGHLKNEDFFAVETYPKSEFEVTGFEKQSENKYSVSGNLTLRGVTKNITFPAEVETSDETVKITSEFKINRSNFNINYEGMKDDLINEEVVLQFDLEATPEA